jgi:hypothetical protein
MGKMDQPEIPVINGSLIPIEDITIIRILIILISEKFLLLSLNQIQKNSRH